MRASGRVQFEAALVMAIAVLSGCGGYGAMAPVESASRAPASKATRPNVYVVQRGDTLYSIAWRYGFDYRHLAAWNFIGEPYIIYPGQKLRLASPPKTASTPTTGRSPAPARGAAKRPITTRPETPATRPEVPANPENTASRTTGGSRTTSGPSLKKRGKAAANKGGNVPVKRWHWPARGRVVTSFYESGGKGIDIAGKLGQPIVAASNGRVVYSGSGLIGYGQLIIVKHNKRYLSAYAHNNKILVKEGDTVTGGQRIAEMGRSGSNRALLHFEIRRDGKPIDPIRYLPK